MSHIKIRNLSETAKDKLIAYFESEIRPKLHDDPSNYARGRKILWLRMEWSLKDKIFIPGSALQNENLWKLCKKIFPPADLGLITLGTGGINWHRDDSYADFHACSINLGECSWGYKQGYPHLDKWTKEQDPNAEQETIELKGGEVIEFNSKNLHCVLNPSPNRWSINLWKVRNVQRYKIPKNYR